MALLFKCSKCDHKIVVKHLQPGEEAKCFACGAFNIVPNDAMLVVCEADYLRIKSECENKIVNPEHKAKKNILKWYEFVIIYIITLSTLFLSDHFFPDHDKSIQSIAIFIFSNMIIAGSVNVLASYILKYVRNLKLKHTAKKNNISL